MNAFYEHHRDSIRFGYRCFDRLLQIPTKSPADSEMMSPGDTR